MLDGHRDGTVNGGDAIWALVNLELWYRTFIDRAGVQSLPAPDRDSGLGTRDSFPTEPIESRTPNPESRERTANV